MYISNDNSNTIISPKVLRKFTLDVLQAYGTDNLQAEVVADILVWSNEIGRSSNGVRRLPILCKRLSSGLINTPCKPRLEMRSDSLALLDGDNGLGHYVGHVGMRHAIDIAAEHGISAVVVRGSNFYGAGAYYVECAAKKGMLALALSNSFPKVVPYNGLKAVFGTNPFSFGAPHRNGKSVLFDMATAACSGSMIRRCQETNTELADGIAIAADGTPLKDPHDIGSGALLPAAGVKGFGLALLVEIFCGVISGAGISHQVRSMYYDFDSPGNNGHFFFALDIKHLMPIEDYFARMELLISYIKGSPGLDGEILYPGEIRWKNKSNTKEMGIHIGSETIEELEALAAAKNISLPW